MTLFLLRHGNAEVRAATDRERGLTQAGRQEIQQVLSACDNALAKVEGIWVSPYRRAMETLEAARPYLPPVPVRECDFLIPSGSPGETLQALGCVGPVSLLLITHQPLIGTLLDDLCDFEPGQYRLGTGSLAAVEVDPVCARGMGALKWLRHP